MANTGRRARNRALRNQQLTDAAAAIIAEVGLDGLTMQAVADRVDCAVGTIYTYFASKSALLAALQSNAIRVLADSYERAAASWDDALDAANIDDDTASLARIVAIGRLFTAWPDLHPRDFEFLQMLIATREQLITFEDLQAVVPQALLLLSEARVLIDAAAELGALRMDPELPGDDSLSRTIRFIGGMDAAVLVADASIAVRDLDPDVFDRRRIAENITRDFLLAWGATPSRVAAAFAAVQELESRESLIPAARP
jgi:AcrR family transcriptional regulator